MEILSLSGGPEYISWPTFPKEKPSRQTHQRKFLELNKSKHYPVVVITSLGLSERLNLQMENLQSVFLTELAG